MESFILTLPDIKADNLKPREDACLVKQNILCVADGITRDPLKPADFTGLTIKEFLRCYPNPSGAMLSAETFCKSITSYLKNQKINIKELRQAFLSANNQIKKINQQHVPKVDYLVEDFYGCVGGVAAIDEDKLYWGTIGDACISIFGQNKKLKFESSNGLAALKEYLKEYPGSFNKPEHRVEIRSQFRNNPKKIIDGVRVSYGALTGEKNAECFMQFGEQKLLDGDLIILYTDGFIDTIKNKRFLDILYDDFAKDVSGKLTKYSLELASKNYKKYGHERTLLATVY